MSLANKIQKYIHVHHEYPFYSDIRPGGAIPDALITHEEAQTLSKSECIQILDIVKKAAVRVKSLTRPNEMLMVLAFVLKHLKDAELKNLIYESLLEIIVSFNDITLLLKYRTALDKPMQMPILSATTDEAYPKTQKTHLSSGLKRFIQKWYNNLTVQQISQMLGDNRSLNGWSHRDICNLAHIKFSDENKKNIISVAFQRGNRSAYDVQESQEEALARLVSICRIRASEDKKEVVDLSLQHKLSYQHLPTALYSTPEVWEKVLPQLSYKELLYCFGILEDLNLLDVKNPLAKKVGFALGNPKTLKEAKLHPFDIYNLLKLYENNERYNDSAKESFRKAKIAKLKISPNKEILKRLKTAFDQSFDYYPSVGQRIIITIDNRHGMYTKKILSKHTNKHVSCIEASIIIALTYLKREKDVKVLSFSDENDGIELLPIQPSMNFDEALKFCETRKKSKTLHTLDLPFNYAKANRLKADVFLTISDSVIRCAPGTTLKPSTPPTQAISVYQNALKISNVRYIVLGMAKPKRCFEVLGPEEGRILEAAGFTSDTAKVIDEFMKRTY